MEEIDDSEIRMKRVTEAESTNRERVTEADSPRYNSISMEEGVLDNSENNRYYKNK